MAKEELNYSLSLRADLYTRASIMLAGCADVSEHVAALAPPTCARAVFLAMATLLRHEQPFLVQGGTHCKLLPASAVYPSLRRHHATLSS